MKKNRKFGSEENIDETKKSITKEGEKPSVAKKLKAIFVKEKEEEIPEI